MFPMRNGTGVLFIPAYINHGSTSGQLNGASHCYVVCYLLYVLSTLETNNCPQSINTVHYSSMLK